MQTHAALKHPDQPAAAECWVWGQNGRGAGRGGVRSGKGRRRRGRTGEVPNSTTFPEQTLVATAYPPLILSGSQRISFGLKGDATRLCWILKF